MLFDPNVAFLGTETYNSQSKLVFADGDLDTHTDPDTVDTHEDLEWHWSWDIDFEAGTAALVDEQAGEDAMKFVPDGPVEFNSGIELGGPFYDVDIADTTIRFSGIDAENPWLEFRASSTDWDRIFAFDRHSNSDYDMVIWQGGSQETVLTTADDDILREGDEPYPAIENDGTGIHGGAGTLNFGADLSAVEDGTDRVTIEYTGGTVPARVYDDGVEVVTDANGIDFLDDLHVVESTEDNIAEISVDHSAMLMADENEQIGGDWTFNGTINFDGYAVFDSKIMGEIESADEADYATDAGWADNAGQLSGATRSDLAELTRDETISGRWEHDDNLYINGDNRLYIRDDWYFWASASNSEMYLEGPLGVVATVSDGSVDFEAAEVGGDSVATERWVETAATANHAQSADHATTADDADDATHWSGYELVVDDETPDSNQYIRMERA